MGILGRLLRRQLPESASTLGRNDPVNAGAAESARSPTSKRTGSISPVRREPPVKPGVKRLNEVSFASRKGLATTDADLP